MVTIMSLQNQDQLQAVLFFLPPACLVLVCYNDAVKNGERLVSRRSC